MLAPRWMHLGISLLFASALLPTSILSYPIGTPRQVSHLLSPESLSRRSPQPAKRKRISKSPPPHAQTSTHHHTPDPKTPSPEGSPRTGPLEVDPSPHARTRSKSAQKIRSMTSNLRTDSLRSKDYREHTKARFNNIEEQEEKDGNIGRTTIDWKTHEADHLLELQTVTEKINKHKGSITLSKKCLEALKKPLNDDLNLRPLHKDANANKKKVVTAIAAHDRFDSIHKLGGSAGPKASGTSNSAGKTKEQGLPELHDFDKPAADHIWKHRNAILRTAEAVDRAMAEHCSELSKTSLVKPGGKVYAQARLIVAHANKINA